MAVQLNDQEARALNNFIGENWASFLVSSGDYLTESEAEALAEKLEDN